MSLKSPTPRRRGNNMDTCHCLHPNPQDRPNPCCLSCGLPWSEKNWSVDPRVTEGIRKEVEQRKEWVDLTDIVMGHGYFKLLTETLKKEQKA